MSNFATDVAAVTTPARSVRHALAALLPGRARRFARRCVELDARARRVFVRQTIRRLARREYPAYSRHGGSYHHVVFVCHGNILRSPFAAALLARELNANYPDVVIGSAGLHARSGRPADPRGIVAAQSADIDLRSHRAAPLTAELVRAADLLVVMDFANEAECIAWFPDAEGKVRLLGAFDATGSRDSIEIPDPYTLDGAAVAHCYENVARCISGLRSALVEGPRRAANTERR